MTAQAHAEFMPIRRNNTTGTVVRTPLCPTVELLLSYYFRPSIPSHTAIYATIWMEPYLVPLIPNQFVGSKSQTLHSMNKYWVSTWMTQFAVKVMTNNTHLGLTFCGFWSNYVDEWFKSALWSQWLWLAPIMACMGAHVKRNLVQLMYVHGSNFYQY